MSIAYSKIFLKQAKKLDLMGRRKLYGAIQLFTENPTHTRLRNHVLTGKYKLYRSIDVTGDLRVLYLQQEDGVVFDIIGTYSQLYG